MILDEMTLEVSDATFSQKSGKVTAADSVTNFSSKYRTTTYGTTTDDNSEMMTVEMGLEVSNDTFSQKNGNVTAASVTHLSSMISLFGGEENTIIAMSLMLAFCIISIAAVISVVIYCKNKKSRNNGADIETADTEQENAFKLE